MENRFFKIALRRAAAMAGRKTRLLLLLTQLASKLRSVNWKNVTLASAKDKFSVLGRLIKAYALGHYRAISWKPLLAIIASVVYFISPIDLLPDLIPLTGLTDDFAVLLWVYNSVSTEIDKFLTWEQSQIGAS